VTIWVVDSVLFTEYLSVILNSEVTKEVHQYEGKTSLAKKLLTNDRTANLTEHHHIFNMQMWPY